MSDSDCEMTHGVAAELALGVAVGEERARAVRHVEACLTCRRELARLGDLVDALMLMAPEREPPVGFESRVVTAMQHRRRRPAWRRLVAYAVAATVAAAATGIGAYLLTDEDRTLAAQFRTALERAGGQYFGVEFLVGDGDRAAGHVFVYRGDPSWAFVVLTDRPPGRFDVEVVTREGTVLDGGTLEIRSGAGGAGLVLPVDLVAVELIRLVPVEGGSALEAHMPEPPA